MGYCKGCDMEFDPALGCECGDYEPGMDKVSDHVERSTGYRVQR